MASWWLQQGVAFAVLFWALVLSIGKARYAWRFALPIGTVLAASGLYELTKVPYVLPIFGDIPFTNATYHYVRCRSERPPPSRTCTGLEFNPNLHGWFGYRSYKIFVDPVLFLGPHIILGSTYLLVLALVFLKRTTMERAALPFVGLTAAILLHTLPVADDFPGALPNYGLATVMFVGAALVAWGYKKKCQDTMRVGYALQLVNLIMPAGELLLLALSIPTFLRTGNWPAPDGDRPHHASGHDIYARLNSGNQFTWLPSVLAAMASTAVLVVALGGEGLCQKVCNAPPGSTLLGKLRSCATAMKGKAREATEKVGEVAEARTEPAEKKHD